MAVCMGNGVISPLQMDEWTGRSPLWSTTNCFTNTSRPQHKVVLPFSEFLVGGWTNPIEKICSSKWVHLNQFSGLKLKNIWVATTYVGLDMFLRIAFLFIKKMVCTVLWIHSFGRQLSLVIHLEGHNNNLSLLDYVSPNLCYPNDIFLRMHNLYMSCCDFFNEIASIVWLFGQVKSMIGINFLKTTTSHNMGEAKLLGRNEKNSTRQGGSIRFNWICFLNVQDQTRNGL